MKKLVTLAIAVSLTTAFIAIRPGFSDDAKPKTRTKAKVQSVSDDKPTAAQRQARKKRRQRLPNYYGKVGVSNEQRETIYAIQAKYRPQIEELEKKIAALTRQRDEEIFNVLTDSQKEELERLVEEAKKRRRERKKKAAAARVSKKAEAGRPEK